LARLLYRHFTTVLRHNPLVAQKPKEEKASQVAALFH